MDEPENSPPRKPRLPLGQIVATPGALSALVRAGVAARQLLERHSALDYGDVCRDDWIANDYAVVRGERVLSSYVLAPGEKVWVITEADRSSTTLLIPDEY